MKLMAKELRQLIREEVAASQPQELPKLLDSVIPQLSQAQKTLERAFEAAPPGKLRAIITGLHSDLLQTIHAFRGHIDQIKKAARQG